MKNIKKNHWFILLFISMTQIINAQCNLTQISGISGIKLNSNCGFQFIGGLGKYGAQPLSCGDLIFSSVLIDQPLATEIKVTGLKEIAIVFPNPVQNTVNIDWKEIKQPCVIEVVNLYGQKINSYNKDQGSQVSAIDVSSLSFGIYFLKIIEKNDNKIYLQKIIKN